MNIHSENELNPKDGTETPKEVYTNRRKIIAGLGLAAIGGGAAFGYQWFFPDPDKVKNAGLVKPVPKPEEPKGDPGPEEPTEPKIEKFEYPAELDPKYVYGRPESKKEGVFQYCNFYEFASHKQPWKNIDTFNPSPWEFEVSGMCRNPMKLDMDDLYTQFASDFTERQYRHRCVETWAMAVPWTGIPLSAIIKAADPTEKAKFVKFVTFNDPVQAPRLEESYFPWPYQEGLTIDEANNELTFLATGLYGEALLKQNGAPVRIVIPWKYGFKSIKSIVKIEFTDTQPKTFWNTMASDEYDFKANVNPSVPHPRWSQASEWMVDDYKLPGLSVNRIPTKIFNGYEKYVAHLYKDEYKKYQEFEKAKS